MKTIKIKVQPDGNSTVSVEGACGSECESLVAPIQSALGSAQEVRRTADYNRTQAVTQSQAAGQ